jgi:hypothetical protein
VPFSFVSPSAVCPTPSPTILVACPSLLSVAPAPCSDNRNLRTKAGNTSAESLLPAFLDLVLWGHEHESRPGLVRADSGKMTFVLQPGSTVATSLCEGEAAPKHCFLLEVRGAQFRSTAIPLRCVRPFGMRHVSLREDARIPEDAGDADARMARYLEAQVREELPLHCAAWLCSARS